ncbi:MAG TPA: 2-dehydropantoate 2-reductase [Solirubrobacteraceae bacterium]|jgi:2-dehydropantoate 2-reductase|nr:2-dehydropantoate 2-reductase [Solirubrobacteraceae bacterium]
MIVVLGAGGVGGLVAALFDRAGIAATVVAREETADVLRRRGFTVNSVRFGEFAANPRVVTRIEADHDVLVVATKANGLEDGLKRIVGRPTLVVPLLNGLDHLPVLRERFGTRAVAATIRVEADRRAPGVIVHNSNFLRLEMASSDPALRRPMEEFAQRCGQAGIEAAVLDSEARVMWAKLVRLNALACTTSASGLRLGELRDDPVWWPRFTAAIDEAVAVATAEGAPLDPAKVVAELREAHATLSSSMARDIEAGREPELDAIAGAVLRAADRNGIAAPTIEWLAAAVADRAGIAPPARPRAA